MSANYLAGFQNETGASYVKCNLLHKSHGGTHDITFELRTYKRTLVYKSMNTKWAIHNWEGHPGGLRDPFLNPHHL